MRSFLFVARRAKSVQLSDANASLLFRSGLHTSYVMLVVCYDDESFIVERSRSLFCRLLIWTKEKYFIEPCSCCSNREDIVSNQTFCAVSILRQEWIDDVLGGRMLSCYRVYSIGTLAPIYIIYIIGIPYDRVNQTYEFTIREALRVLVNNSQSLQSQ